MQTKKPEISPGLFAIRNLSASARRAPATAVTADAMMERSAPAAAVPAAGCVLDRRHFQICLRVPDIGQRSGIGGSERSQRKRRASKQNE
jgi:hypothetical protein